MLDLADFLYKHKYEMNREFTLDENIMGPKGFTRLRPSKPTTAESHWWVYNSPTTIFYLN
jgi:hypothetical protein